MSDAEDMAVSFGRATEDDKLESFERSTLKLVLRRMGMKKQRVDRLDAQLAEGFTFDWLQNQGWGIQGRILTTRCFNFDLQSLLIAPKKSALIAHLQDLWRENELDDDAVVIFRANGVGRMVCMTGNSELQTRVPGSAPYVVTPFTYATKETVPVDQALFMTFDDFCSGVFTGEEIDE